jgi:predicted MFS family arabinose efflux permease
MEAAEPIPTAQNQTDTGALPKGTLWLMSLACGVSVANLIYNQPLLGDFARDFSATPEAAGQVATVSQVGYGLGLLFLLPLGDLVERRRLVIALTVLCAALMATTAFTPTLPLLILAHLFIGVTSMSAQILIPMGVEMAPAERRGHTVGTLMTGLLGGILLARTVSGVVADQFGWRVMYGVAAVMMVALAGALAARLPHRPPTLRMSYGRLMGSLWELIKTQPRLWPATLVSALSFASFSVFWTALSFLMREQFHRGASEAGLFGVVGLVGALGAPFAGKISDRLGSAFLVTVSLIVCAAAFGLMWAWVTIPSLIIGVLLMDLGAQSVQVAEQSKVIALVPEARSRLNALYMVGRFAGGAVGSLTGAFAWAHGGWAGVCISSILMTVLALVVHFVGARRALPDKPGTHEAEDFLKSEEVAECPLT